ncbi:PAS domain-containing protein [Aeromonas sp. A-5]|uniref:PAS domain-containing protein n=1 Tax=Aeromonas ichthyocola TaxID=3367746 RepID=UPI0038E83CDA
MFNHKLKAQLQACQARLDEEQGFAQGIKSGAATIIFSPDGEILEVSDPFLSLMGYGAGELLGRHHSLLCPKGWTGSTDYQQFWSRLRQGQPQSGIFQRVNQKGETRWLEASYFPVKQQGRVVPGGQDGQRCYRASPAPAESGGDLPGAGSLPRHDRVHPDGEIVTPMPISSSCMGYSLSQLKGQHHRLFCDEAFYREQPHFWDELAHGQFKSGLFMRRDSHGNAIWLEATYNPVRDESGKVVKVIKFASDMTSG